MAQWYGIFVFLFFIGLFRKKKFTKINQNPLTEMLDQCSSAFLTVNNYYYICIL